MQTITRQLGSGHNLQLLMTKNGTGIAGQTPLVEVRRLSDNKYLDHSALVVPFWVTSGGVRQIVMPPVPWLSGAYSFFFNPLAVGISVYEVFDFIVTNTGTYALTDIEHVIYEEMEDKVDGLVNMIVYLYKINRNRLKIDKVANTLTLYEDDQVTPLRVFNLYDQNGQANWKNILERLPV